MSATPELFCLTTDACRVTLTNAGAAIVAVEFADRSGTVANVCLPLGDPAAPATAARYLENPSNFGAVVGRFANRIGGASFALDGETYPLEANNGPNNLHSGSANLGQRLWECVEHSPERTLFQVTTLDDDGGFPGDLTVTASYSLEGSRLTLQYEAVVTGQPTVINLTNHAYWNLGGVDAGARRDVLRHVLHLHADSYLPSDETVLPTGEIAAVEGTTFDFRTPTAIGRGEDRPPGYDHCFVVRGEAGTLRPVGSLVDPASGRRMTIAGTQPGVQLYTANHFGGEPANNGFSAFEGVALECENFPNAPNAEGFPSPVLRPGETYRERTDYAFSVDR